MGSGFRYVVKQAVCFAALMSIVLPCAGIVAVELYLCRSRGVDRAPGGYAENIWSFSAHKLFAIVVYVPTTCPGIQGPILLTISNTNFIIFRDIVVCMITACGT